MAMMRFSAIVAVALLVGNASAQGIFRDPVDRSQDIIDEEPLAPATKKVTPIMKVIELLEGIRQKTTQEGSAEAGAYDQFACFCKSTSTEKSNEVLRIQGEIDVQSAGIEKKTAEKEDAIAELTERKVDQEKLAANLSATETRCLKEKTEYENEAAELDKAISSVELAIQALEDAKPTPAMLLQVKESITLAMAKGLISKSAAANLLQARVDPSSPEYKYHSQPIIEVLEKLLAEFRENKKELDADYAEKKKACDELTSSLKADMRANEGAMKGLKLEIQRLSTAIAGLREDLENNALELKDHKTYIRDLTARCEQRAKDYDQRSQMRAGELEALSKAIAILKDRVDPAEDVNVRALFQKSATGYAATSNTATQAKATVSAEKREATKASPSPSRADEPALRKPLSFLQREAPKKSTFLQRTRGATGTEEARRARVVALLEREGQRLGSTAIAALTTHAAADPFKKVKELIQKLIERLLKESAEEATKKGFCDTELGKARNERDFRYEEAMQLSAELFGLQAKEAELTQEIAMLTENINQTAEELANATELRAQDKANNQEILETAEEGLEALKEAIHILKSFYKEAAKAKVALAQASPLDEDTDGPGFKGAYKGQQSGMQAVFGLLEVLLADFQRTVKFTHQNEKAAYEEFVEFERVSKASIASMETKKKLDEQDLETTTMRIATATQDMKTAMELVDEALKEIEELRPTCIDTGMSYADRVAKREDEIVALKKALCILDTDGVEEMCPVEEEGEEVEIRAP